MDDATWVMVETERLTLAVLLDKLTSAQWATPSLCAEWRVREVAAHLAMTPARAPGAWTMVRALAAARGNLWRAGRDVAVDYARRPCEQIAGDIRRDAAARARPVFVVADNILLDLIVHGQDIAVPLGVSRPVPPEAGALVLRRIWTMGWPFHARRRLGGFSLRANDCDWSAGVGPAVSGSAAGLLLLATGRTATAVKLLHGPGVELIQSELAGLPRGQDEHHPQNPVQGARRSSDRPPGVRRD